MGRLCAAIILILGLLIGGAGSVRADPITGTIAFVVAQGASISGSSAQAVAQTFADYFREITWGLIDLTPVVLTGASIRNTCGTDTAGVIADADAALAQAGYAQPYRTAIIVPGPCGYSGWGDFYGTHIILPNHVATGTTAHEFGHTFSVQHNLSFDVFDIMTGLLHPNAHHKGRINWRIRTGAFEFPTADPRSCYWEEFCEWVVTWDVVASIGSRVILDPIEVPSPTGVPVVAKVPLAFDTSGRATVYIFIEYRQAIGVDAAKASLLPAVILHEAGPYNYFGGTANGKSQDLAILNQGEVWEDCARGIRVVATALSNSAVIDIENCVAPPPPPPGDTTPPTATILSPTNGTTVARRSIVNISVMVSDDVGVTRVDFLINGVILCSGTALNCAWRVPSPPNKVYRLQVRAYDAAGNQGLSSIVTVTSR